MSFLATAWWMAQLLTGGEAFERAPILSAEVQAHYLSSYDRSGGNDDGFDGTYSALYVDERGEQVIFDVIGPGRLDNLWFTSRENGWSALGTGRIKFYFDDEAEPRIDMDIDQLFSGRHSPFVPPFVFHAFQSSGGYVSYMPFPFRHRLTITTERRVGFYNAYYHTYASDREVESWTEDADRASLESMWNRPGTDPKPERKRLRFSGKLAVGGPSLPDGEPVPGKAVVLTHRGAGSVAALRFNPLFPLTDYQLQHILLRFYWDGESQPSVEAPLGSFFGSGLGEASVRSVPIGMSPSGEYYCYFPMPFWESLRLELVNENPEPTPEIHWEVEIVPESAFPYPRDESGYFQARYRKEWPTTTGVDYHILDLEADRRGLYLGQVMTVEPLRPEVKRWWEGDLRLYLDGRRHPAFHGTGHEDEYLGGWSNEWLMNPYSLPMHGEPKTTLLTQVDFQWSAATTVYRFFAGGIPFQRGLSISTEHGAGNTANALYSSVAYYYERAGGLVLVDALDVGDAEDEQKHGYQTTPASGLEELDSEFEGREDGVSVGDSGRRIGKRSSFTLTSGRGARHLRLRRLYDQSRVQQAEVWLNGEKIGVWYAAATNPAKRWAETDFLLPSRLDGGELEIEIRVLRPEWNEFRYQLWGLR